MVSKSPLASFPLEMVYTAGAKSILQETVITCFDRRWEEDNNFQANVLDRLLQWKLPNNATRIKTAYDLAHIIIDEASGFFFSYSSSLPRSLRFAEIFRAAIGSVVSQDPRTLHSVMVFEYELTVHLQNNHQTNLFSRLENLTHKGPAIELTRREQNDLLSVQAEFALVREVRDLADELGMIRHVYDAQLGLLDPLFDMQYSDALFRSGRTDLFGNLLRPADGEAYDPVVAAGGLGNSPDASFAGDDGGAAAAKTKGERQRDREEQRQAILAPIRWDEREWFNRTAQYMRRHRETIQDMIDDTEKIYTAVSPTWESRQSLKLRELTLN